MGRYDVNCLASCIDPTPSSSSKVNAVVTIKGGIYIYTESESLTTILDIARYEEY